MLKRSAELEKKFPPTKLFYSYAQQDEAHVEELEKHLRIFQRNGHIQTWHKKQILAGQDWNTTNNQHLHEANIILLVLSPDFLASDYCYDVEVKSALERHQRQSAIVIPILLRVCPWKDTHFKHLQMLPRNGQPIISEYWFNKDKAYNNVIEDLKRLIVEKQSNFLELQKNNKKTDTGAFVMHQESETSEVELILKGRIEDFSESDKSKFLGAIEKLLEMEEASLKIKKIRSGSIIISLDIPKDKVEMLEKAVKEGRLDKYNVIKIARKDRVHFDSIDKSNNILNGRITFQNSGFNAVGVKVADAFDPAPPVYTDEYGDFSLTFSNKKAGDKINLRIGNKDKEGTTIEVVNEKEKDQINLPSKPTENIIRIVVCPKGQRDEAARNYYNIIKKVTDLDYTQKISEIENRLQQQHNLNKDELLSLLKQIKELREEWNKAIYKVENQATYIAHIDLDQASELVRQAIYKIEQEEDVETALLILDEEELDKIYNNAAVRKHKSEQEIRQVVKGYELKINLLTPLFKFEKIVVCYEKIVTIKETQSLLFEKNELVTSYLYCAKAYLDAGKTQKSLELGKKSITIWEEILDANHPDLAIAYNNISLTYKAMGQYKQALKFDLKSLAIREVVVPRNYLSLATAYSNTGSTYHLLGEYEKGLEFELKSVAIREKILNPSHPDLALSYNNISSSYLSLGLHKQSLEFDLKSLAIREEILDTNHPHLAFSYNNIGGTYLAMGQYEKALEFHLKSVNTLKKILAPNHPNLATIFNGISATYQKLGKYKQALNFQLKSISIRENLLNLKHPDLAISYNNIGQIYQKMGKYELALEFQLKSVSIFEEILSSRHPDLATVYDCTGAVYDLLSEYDQALNFHLKCLAIREEILKSNHPSLATVYKNIGSVYWNLNQYEKALEFDLKSMAIREEMLPSNHPDLAAVYNAIGVTYNSLGKHEKALKYGLKSIVIQEKNLDSNHPDLAIFYNNIGDTYQLLREYKKALKYQLLAVSIQEEILDSKHPNLATFYNNLGNTYHYIKKYKQALIFHQKALSIRKEILDTLHPNLAATYYNIGTDYWRIEQLEKAIFYKTKAYEIWKTISHKKTKSVAKDLMEIHEKIGLDDFKSNRFLKSSKHWRAILQINSSNAPARAYICLCYYHLKRFNAAYPHLQEALALQYNYPPHVEAWLMKISRDINTKK